MRRADLSICPYNISFFRIFMRLVVQGSQLTHHHLATMHAHLHVPSGIQFIQSGANAFYLPMPHWSTLSEKQQSKIRFALKQFSYEQNIDIALVENHLNVKHLGLAVMDMDSTLISIECIDEIADMQGIKPKVAEITESAMRGEIEFAESLRRRVALLAGLPAEALQRVVDERLQLNPGAKDWISCCQQHGIKTLLVSGGFDFFAHQVQQLLGLDMVYANRLEIIDGKLTGKVLGDIVDAKAKADYLLQTREQFGLNPDQTVAIGDGANDLEMMRVAAAGVAYHAKPVVQEQATFALNHVGLEGLVHLFTV